jgi:hypothetical protein
MSDTNSKTNFLATVIAALGGVAIFVLIVVIAYSGHKPQPLPDGAKTAEQRQDLLKEQRNKDEKATKEYAWIDQQKGVVQLPVDRAVELTIKELNTKK